MAYETLRRHILDGTLAGGRRVTTADLCTLLEMSATPVREATRRLEAEGLVRNEPHRGVTVIDLAALDVDDFSGLRGQMEALATKHAVRELTAQDLTALQALHAEVELAASRADDRVLTSANVRWHMRIYSACPHKALVTLIQQLWMPFHWTGGHYWPTDGLRALTVRDHADVMEALLARDAELAGRRMHDHIDRVQGEIRRRSTPVD